jgi:hypothetical protein
LRGETTTHGSLSGGHWLIVKTNIHFIHAALNRGLEFLSIYLCGEILRSWACLL